MYSRALPGGAEAPWRCGGFLGGVEVPDGWLESEDRSQPGLGVHSATAGIGGNHEVGVPEHQGTGTMLELSPSASLPASCRVPAYKDTFLTDPQGARTETELPPWLSVPLFLLMNISANPEPIIKTYYPLYENCKLTLPPTSLRTRLHSGGERQPWDTCGG